MAGLDDIVSAGLDTLNSPRVNAFLAALGAEVAAVVEQGGWEYSVEFFPSLIWDYNANCMSDKSYMHRVHEMLEAAEPAVALRVGLPTAAEAVRLREQLRLSNSFWVVKTPDGEHRVIGRVSGRILRCSSRTYRHHPHTGYPEDSIEHKLSLITRSDLEAIEHLLSRQPVALDIEIVGGVEDDGFAPYKLTINWNPAAVTKRAEETRLMALAAERAVIEAAVKGASNTGIALDQISRDAHAARVVADEAQRTAKKALRRGW